MTLLLNRSFLCRQIFIPLVNVVSTLVLCGCLNTIICMPDFDPIVLNKSKIKHNISLMQHKYILHGQHTIQHSKKLEFYYTFKNEYTPSCYLELTSKLNEIKN